MKIIYGILFFLLSISAQAQEAKSSAVKPNIDTTKIVGKAKTTAISDPQIRNKNSLPISSKTNPEVFFVDKDKPSTLPEFTKSKRKQSK